MSIINAGFINLELELVDFLETRSVFCFRTEGVSVIHPYSMASVQYCTVLAWIFICFWVFFFMTSFHFPGVALD